MHALYRARLYDFFGKVQEMQGKNSVMLESRVKLLVRIRERIEIIDMQGSATPD